MSASTFTVMEAIAPASKTESAPFASEFVTLSKQEHIELTLQAHYFRSMHQRALERAAWREDRLLRLLHQMKEPGAQREAALRAELEQERAKVRDLQQRLFGRKSEHQRPGERQGRAPSAHAPRPTPTRAPAWSAQSWALHAIKPACAPRNHCA